MSLDPTLDRIMRGERLEPARRLTPDEIAAQLAAAERAQAERADREARRAAVARGGVPPEIVAAARLLGMPPYEIDRVEQHPAGLVVTTVEGAQVIVVAEDRPDGAGRTGVLRYRPKVHDPFNPVPIYVEPGPATPEPAEHDAEPAVDDPAREVPPGAWLSNPGFCAVVWDVWDADPEVSRLTDQLADLEARLAACLDGERGVLERKHYAVAELLGFARNRAFADWTDQHPAGPDPGDVATYTAAYSWATELLTEQNPRELGQIDRRYRDAGHRWLPRVDVVADADILRRERDAAAEWLTRHGIALPEVGS